VTPADILRSDPRESRCRRLHNEHPDCRCELESGAAGSPGPVRDSEPMVRIIYSPNLWDAENGVVKTAAFSEAETCGMSVVRLEHATDEMLQQQVTTRIEAKPGREFIKLVKAKMAELKEIDFEGRRAFCCYDTPMDGNIAHADICQAHPADRKSVRAGLRRQLQKRFVEHEWRWQSETSKPTSATQ